MQKGIEVQVNIVERIRKWLKKIKRQPILQ